MYQKEFLYLIAAVLLLLGLVKISFTKTVGRGVFYTSIGVFLSQLPSLFTYNDNNGLISLAIISGLICAYFYFKNQEKIARNSIMNIALSNAMGSGVLSFISIDSIRDWIICNQNFPFQERFYIVLGGLISTLSFAGSLFAFFKLRKKQEKKNYYQSRSVAIFILLILVIVLGMELLHHRSFKICLAFYAMILLLGFLMTSNVRKIEIPILITLYTTLTGLAVACGGIVVFNKIMIIVGFLVGAVGYLLIGKMEKIANRSLAEVLFGNYKEKSRQGKVMKTVEIKEVAIMLSYVKKIIIVPGYGLAASRAQNELRELFTLLIEKEIEVKFAIHPVSGRMPGHMNILLAEAGISYDYIYDMEEINKQFKDTDVVLVIGADDVVNPAAREDKKSPLYGMSILNVDQAKEIFVIKKEGERGYAGVDNPLFYIDNCYLLYGDALQVLSEMIRVIKKND